MSNQPLSIREPREIEREREREVRVQHECAHLSSVHCLQLLVVMKSVEGQSHEVKAKGAYRESPRHGRKIS